MFDCLCFCSPTIRWTIISVCVFFVFVSIGLKPWLPSRRRPAPGFGRGLALHQLRGTCAQLRAAVLPEGEEQRTAAVQQEDYKFFESNINYKNKIRHWDSGNVFWFWSMALRLMVLPADFDQLCDFARLDWCYWKPATRRRCEWKVCRVGMSTLEDSRSQGVCSKWFCVFP